MGEAQLLAAPSPPLALGNSFSVPADHIFRKKSNPPDCRCRCAAPSASCLAKAAACSAACRCRALPSCFCACSTCAYIHQESDGRYIKQNLICGASFASGDILMLRLWCFLWFVLLPPAARPAAAAPSPRVSAPAPPGGTVQRHVSRVSLSCFTRQPTLQEMKCKIRGNPSPRLIPAVLHPLPLSRIRPGASGASWCSLLPLVCRLPNLHLQRLSKTTPAGAAPLE